MRRLSTFLKPLRQESAGTETKTMRENCFYPIDASPVPFVPVDDLEMPAYYDSKQQTIFIKTGLSEEQAFVSMAKGSFCGGL